MPIYCINPNCLQRENPDDDLELKSCQTCGTPLRIQDKYLLIKPLCNLKSNTNSEVFEVLDLGIWHNSGLQSDDLDIGLDPDGLDLEFESDDLGQEKVLKVLKDNHPTAIRLFEREAEVLWSLGRDYPHLGIPKVDTAKPLIFRYSDGVNELKLPYFLMEKLAGKNLSKWLKENQKLPEKLAINWLQQLVEALAYLHKKELLHRDIKPSNIILKPDGRLVLIDFGSVGKQENVRTRALGTDGYMAPEQYEGQAVPQSDFYSLGRTFVHLLTGIHPLNFFIDRKTDKLHWRDNIYLTPRWQSIVINSPIKTLELLLGNKVINWVIQQLHKLKLRVENNPNNFPEVSATIADLIDDTIALSPKDRPPNAEEILRRLEEVKFPLRPKVRKGLLLLVSSAIATFLVIAIRQVGLLQVWELQAYDKLMQMRPVEQPDSRILVVEINESNLNEYGNPIPDGILTQLLDKLERYQPRVIGLDIYRDRPVEPGSATFTKHLQHNNRLITICSVKENNNPQKPGIKPPRQVLDNRIGFTDFLPDPDDVLRRHLLFMSSVRKSPCSTKFSFSSQLALHYLEATHGIKPKTTRDKEFQIGGITFKPLTSNTGIYQSLQKSLVRYQLLLNYRASKNIAQQVNITDVLKDNINPNWVKDRIVIIGGTAPTTDDNFYTPYSSGQWPYQKVPGVIIHAQMVSQIISAVLDKRPLLGVWLQWQEVIWVWVWSVVGGLVVLRSRSLLNLAVASIIAAGILSGVCFVLLMQGSWVPLVPSALAFIATAGIVLVCQRISLGDFRRLLHGYVLEKVFRWTNRA